MKPKKVSGRIAFYVICENILGPLKRVVIYLQGCKKSCRGCQAASLREIKPLADDISSQLQQIISEAREQGCQGVTISGGEPFLQPQVIAYIQELIEKTGMNLLVYTGYTKAELCDKYDDILSKIDILITGEYIKELDDGLGLRGSSNQEITTKSKALMEMCQELLSKREQKYELVDGRFVTIGLKR